MKKISFENIKNILSRDEMKKIMAGSGRDTGYFCSNNFECELIGYNSSCVLCRYAGTIWATCYDYCNYT